MINYIKKQCVAHHIFLFTLCVQALHAQDSTNNFAESRIILSGPGSSAPIAFSANGARIVSGNGRWLRNGVDDDRFVNRIFALDIATGEIVAQIEGAGWLTSIASSQKSNKLALGEGFSVVLRDPKDLEAIAVFSEHLSRAHDVAFNADDSLVAAAYDNKIRFANSTTNETVAIRELNIPNHKQGGRIRFSSDGKWMACCVNDGDPSGRNAHVNILLLDCLRVDYPLFQVGEQVGLANSVIFLEGERLMSGGRDGVTMWDTRNKRFAAELRHPQFVTCIESCQNETIASADSDGIIRLWDLRQQREPFAVLRGQEKSIFSLIFNPNSSQLVSTSIDETVRVWDFNASSMP